MFPPAKLRRLKELSFPEWKTLIAAGFWFPIVDALLRVGGLRAVRRLAGRPAVAPRRGSCPSVGRTVQLVDAAGRIYLKRYGCLPRALVLQRILARRGVATELRIGVKTDMGRLHGHAWLEAGGMPLGEPAGVRDEFASFTDAGASLL